MNFAKKQLLKFGWTEGKGLGKNENGISEALKPKLKFDNTGVGHNSSEQFTFNWWENVFNNAADNINVSKCEDGNVKIGLNSEDSVNITTKKYTLKHKKNRGLEYGSFLKTAKLTGEGTVDIEDKEACTAEEIVLKTVNLTDDELFAACGGRTAHKGARHGLKLNGKLARIEQQEKMLAKLFIDNKNSTTNAIGKMFENSTQINDVEVENVPEKFKMKKKSKNVSEDHLGTESDSCLEIKKKKKRKRNRDKSEDNEKQIEIEAAQKRYENFCDRKFNKKLKKKRKREEKQFSKIADMFENCSLEKTEKSDDDGFDEHVKTKKIKLSEDLENTPTKKLKKKSKKKKRKYIIEDEHKSTDDAGFFELMSEISDKLTQSKELRRKLRQEKKKTDDERVSKISDVLNRVCKV